MSELIEMVKHLNLVGNKPFEIVEEPAHVPSVLPPHESREAFNPLGASVYPGTARSFQKKKF